MSDKSDSTNAIDDPSGEGNDDPTTTIIQVKGKIALIKTSSKIPATAKVGDTVTYTFVVKNVGQVTVKDVVITDTKIEGVITLDKTTIAPGEEATGIAAYTLTQADFDAGKVTNSATAKGKDAQGNPVEDTSGTTEDSDTPTETEVPQSPGIELIKTSQFNDENGNGFAEVGETITYTFVVENTGNVTLANLTINDSKLAEKELAVKPSKLAPGEKATVTVTYTVTAEDLKKGKVVNSAIVEGTAPNSTKVSDVSDSGNEGDDEGEPGNADEDNDSTNDPTVTPFKKLKVIEVTTTINTPIEIDIAKDDDNPCLVTETVEIDVYPTEGKIGDIEGSKIAYTPAQDYLGEETFITYEICCEETGCIKVKVIVKVICPNKFDEDFEIPQLVTPNNDGKNDVWEIPELKTRSLCSQNYTIKLFNRWGAKVWEKKNYMSDRVRFNGYSTNSLDFRNDELLPSGTYFYIIELSGGKIEKTGYIYILAK